MMAALLVLVTAIAPLLTSTPPPPSVGKKVAAGFSNLFYVPGKAVVCVASGVLWTAVMTLTLRSKYNAAANVWIVTARDIHFYSRDCFYDP